MAAAGLLRCLDAPARIGPGEDLRGTLVLLHAFPLNAHMWEPQLAIADRGWRVIAPHLRGFDGGGFRTPPSSMDDYADDVIELLDALHVTQAVVGGLSMGGYLAFALWRLAPRLFRGLILADTRPQSDTPQIRQQREGLLARVQDEGAAGVADEMVPHLLGDRTRRERPDIVQRVRSLILASSPAAIAAAIRVLMTRDDSTALLASITVPTLVLVGSDDAITPPSVGQAMRDAVPGAEFVMIPGAGHLSNIEQPQRFNDALARFLAHRI